MTTLLHIVFNLSGYHFYTCVYCKHFPVLSSFMIHLRVYNNSNTTDVTSGAGTAYISGASEFTPVFNGVRVVHL
jgi:hypothetical protein